MRLCAFFLLFTTRAGAFHVPSSHPKSTVRLSSTSSSILSNVGGGVPLHPGGDRNLFDPAEQGKLYDTDSLDQRIAGGSQYTHYLAPEDVTAIATGTEQQQVQKEDAQHWLLEDNGESPPAPFCKPTQPVTATVLGRGRLIAPDAPGDIQHVVLQLPQGMHYVEGQSLSVIPPGTNDKGKKHKPRLYSIASTRYGDLLDGATVSLCVRRAVYTDPETGAEDPTKKGVCSNWLCDTQVGDTVSVAGPVGKTMLLPTDPKKDIIMVATGTGIAPFRGFLHRLFMENTVARHMFTGTAWLILGVPVTGGLLYPEELDTMQKNAASGGAGQLEISYAISREMKNAAGGKLYVQDVLAERAEDLFRRLDNGAVIYFCGLKGMMPGILAALERVATDRGLDWSQTLAELKQNGQWHVEVY